MQDEALDEHPQEHGRLAVLDQGVERLAEEGLQRTWDVVMKLSHAKASHGSTHSMGEEVRDCPSSSSSKILSPTLEPKIRVVQFFFG